MKKLERIEKALLVIKKTVEKVNSNSSKVLRLMEVEKDAFVELPANLRSQILNGNGT